MSPNPYLLAATILVAVGFAIWLAVEPRIIARHNAKAADDFERIGRTNKEPQP